MKNLFFATISVLMLSITQSGAKVTLPSIYANDMVIQRDADVLFWGESSAEGKSVTITPSWSKKSYKANVEGGKWSVKVATPVAGGPHTITFNDGDKLTLSNVMSGDVWLCMGQSNMEMPMVGFGFKEHKIAGNTQKNQPIEGSAKMITQAKESQPIRMFSMDFNPNNKVQESVGGAWQTNSPAAVHAFSATGYFFGIELQNTLDIPIGLLSINRGSSTIQTWMSREWLEASGVDFDFSILDNKELPKNVVMQVCYLYNGMLAPIKGLSVKGALWYQGESNRYRHNDYLKLFPTFVAGLREHFDGGNDREFPFYYAEIAPYAGNMGDDDYSVVAMRETMGKLVDLTPRTAMITTTDIGEKEIIHPRYKREVGERFALVALCDTYGVEGVHYQAPSFASIKQMTDPQIKLPGLAIALNNCPTGVSFKNRIGGSTQFEIAGEDMIFYPAQSKLAKNMGAHLLWVWSDKVANPVAVRYAFKNYAEGDIYNMFGMPLPSFRSDDWELPIPRR